jgi:alpha-glucoside transport system permease protein
VRRWWPAHWRALGLLAPAGLVVAAGLAAPLLFTIGVSVAAPGGLGNYGAVLRDPAVGRAMAHSALWVAFAVAVCVAGLGVAWLAHRAERQAETRAGRRALRAVIAVLAAPVAVSAFAAGTASRMMFGAQPDSLGFGGYGPGATWLVLLLAFGWQWLGLAVIVFRAGLAGMPADLLRVARALGAGRLRRAVSVALPALFPAAALVVIIVLVAAARVFELVIAAAPGAMQDQVDVVGVHLWRFGPTLGNGKSAALAVLLTAFVAVVALVGLWGLNREWPSGHAPARPGLEPGPGPRTRPRTAPRPGGRAARLTVTLVAAAVTAAWLLPFAVLLLTSLHDPAPAATGHWWSGGWGFGSWSAAFADGQLLPAIGDTAARAVTATVLLVVLAVPAAYALAWGGLPRLAVRAAVAVATVLAVVPPQAVAIPLGLGLDRLQLLGASWPLTGVYVAFALPLAVLLLRGSFASVPREVVRAGQFDPARGAALLAVIARCGPALVAVAVFGFSYVWNDLLIGLLFGGTEAGQATLVLFGQTREFATSAGQLAAGAVLITAVPLVVVLATGRWLARGLTEGVRR